MDVFFQKNTKLENFLNGSKLKSASADVVNPKIGQKICFLNRLETFIHILQKIGSPEKRANGPNYFWYNFLFDLLETSDKQTFLLLHETSMKTKKNYHHNLLLHPKMGQQISFSRFAWNLKENLAKNTSMTRRKIKKYWAVLIYETWKRWKNRGKNKWDLVSLTAMTIFAMARK